MQSRQRGRLGLRSLPMAVQVASWMVTAFLVVGLIAGSENSDDETAAARRPTTTLEALTTTEPEATTTSWTTSSTTAMAAPTTTSATTAQSPGDVVNVTRIVDGDTIEVSGGEKVRLIGIATPETKHPRQPVECFGAQATEHATELMGPGTSVRLIADVEHTDRYGRSLAYVYRVTDNLFVNLEMIRDGFAVTATYPPNVAHVEAFGAAEREDRSANRGLWDSCGGADTPAGPSGPPPPSALPTSPSGDGVDRDCSHFYSHQAAQSFYEAEGGPVRDPHRLDGDGNGLACESLRQFSLASRFCAPRSSPPEASAKKLRCSPQCDRLFQPDTKTHFLVASSPGFRPE